MRALHSRLASVGASLALVLTGVGGVGSAWAQQEVTNTAVTAACVSVAVAEANDDEVNSQVQGFNVAVAEANDDEVNSQVQAITVVQSDHTGAQSSQVTQTNGDQQLWVQDWCLDSGPTDSAEHAVLHSDSRHGAPPSRYTLHSQAAAAVWVRGYPSEGNPAFGMTAGCVYYVAQWSDGTYTATPWDCQPGIVAREGPRTSARGYPQLAANGCIEYVTRWSDGSFSWVPFECPAGIIYSKP